MNIIKQEDKKLLKLKEKVNLLDKNKFTIEAHIYDKSNNLLKSVHNLNLKYFELKYHANDDYDDHSSESSAILTSEKEREI